MRAVVIGGHTRNIGKTSVMSALIREFAPLGWTAVKVTQYGHGICSRDGEPCGCEPEEHPFALTEETDPQGRGDTCRFLAAGARRSLWLRVRQGQLAEAVPLLMETIGSRNGWAMIESNSILEFVDPLLYLAVLDGSKRDFKPSALRALARADGLVPVNDSFGGPSTFPPSLGLASDVFRNKPIFPVQRNSYRNPELNEFVRRRLATSARNSNPPAEEELCQR